MLFEEMWRYCVIKYHFEINMWHVSLKFALKNQHKRETWILQEIKWHHEHGKTSDNYTHLYPHVFSYALDGLLRTRFS